MNINDFVNPRIITKLYAKYYKEDGLNGSDASSHWKKYGRKINVNIDENGKILQFSGYGFGDLQSGRISKYLNHLCNLSYFIRLDNKKDLIYIYGKASENMKKLGFSISYDCFRQIVSLSLTRRYFQKKENDEINVVIIGDGYGFLSSLIKRIYPKSKITLIDLGRVLLFQVINNQKIFPQNKHILLESPNSDFVEHDFLYVPAENIAYISNIKYDLGFNISSMQEMNPEIINKYFVFLRNNCGVNNVFYCCNREKKELVGGEVTEFIKYPWDVKDSHYLDEICGYYTYYFSPKFPVIHRFDGSFRHRITKLFVY